MEHYEEWDMEIPEIPSRSRFYHLEPVGIGTPYVECLTSYITRLAEAHNLRTGTLLSKELMPFLRQTSSSKKGIPYLGDVYKGIGRLNGVGSQAAKCAELLESLTLQGGLQSLTLSSWTEVLPAQGLLRPTRAWCPECYSEWSKRGQVIYEPLLWTLQAVTICPIHQRRLQIYCPTFSCLQLLPWLSPQSRPGYCSNCKHWLGLSPIVKIMPSGEISEEELVWQTWVGKAVGISLAMRETLGIPFSKDRLTRMINSCIEQIRQVRKQRYIRLLGLDPLNFQTWRT